MIAPTLVLIAKKPVSGRVKTRLCPPCTEDEAAAVAAAALADTADVLRRFPALKRIAAVTGDLILDGFDMVAQRGAGLGERLAHAFADAGPGPVLLVGMDTPQLSAPLLAKAVTALQNSPAVIGPATDGGWWLLGLRDPAAAVALAEVGMSRSDTGAETCAALARRGVLVNSIAELTDVDTFDDALMVAATVPGSRFAAEVSATQARIDRRAA